MYEVRKWCHGTVKHATKAPSNRFERSEVKSVILLNARITRRHAVTPLVSALIQEVSEYKAIHQFFRRSHATSDIYTVSYADTHNICTHAVYADGRRRSSSANSHFYPQKCLPILGETRTVIPNQRLGDHWNSIAKRGDPHAHTDTHAHTSSGTAVDASSRECIGRRRCGKCYS